MQEAQVNIFSESVLIKADAICFTSNGIIKRNGEAVMGAGVALSAKRMWPSLPHLLAEELHDGGNQVYELLEVVLSPESSPVTIVSFPTKNDWKDKSDRLLIMTSTLQLVTMTNRRGWKHVFLPRPGCANGGLDWEQEVKPWLTEALDDRFTVCYL